MRFGNYGFRAVLGLLALLAASCVTGCTLQTDYVKSDRLTKTAVEPKLAQFSTDHPEDKQDVDALLYTWEKRLATAEAKGK